ncbi:hypothetical protein L1049_017250 [Liquidambar formosana]|uniref:Large ribosomal subunit protein uL2 C-terminal domain-containing protein n=1 Tax=Liquidambar formosana TaxID=63359 RepID=A0AAP0S0L9_LIQFO
MLNRIKRDGVARRHNWSSQKKGSRGLWLNSRRIWETLMALSRVGTASSTLFSRLIHSRIRSFSTSAHNVFDSASHTSMRESMMNQMFTLDVNSQIGSCMPLAAMRIGTMIHNIEMNPGQGGKLVRAAGTSAKILKEPTSRYCLVRLPSGFEKVIDSRCRATIGTVSNPSHGARKLRKAGQSRWLGRRPVVRGVAMNPVDHPHGGGEGRSKVVDRKGGLRLHHGASLVRVDTKLDPSSAKSSV